MPGEDIRTAFLGRYGDFEADVVLEILRDAGIFAFAKHELEEPEHFMYAPLAESDRGVIMVDAGRLDDAKQLVAEQLPQHLQGIQLAMEELEQEPEAPDNVIPFEPRRAADDDGD